MSTRSLSPLQQQRTTWAEDTVRPDISFYQALSSRFVLDQTIYTVGSCPDGIFRRFITACSQATESSKHWKPLHQQKLLDILEQDCSDVTRWYAIETLLAHRMVVPLFDQFENIPCKTARHQS